MLNPDELALLMDSWLLRLQAERKSPKTIASYREGVTQYLAHCAGHDIQPDLAPNTVAAFVNNILEGGNAPATARLRQLAVRSFSAWLAAEDEIPRDLLIGMKPPKLDLQVVDDLEIDQLAALLKACGGKSLGDKRDEAIVRLMIETGARAGEVIGMNVVDVDIAHGRAVVRGKGGKARTVPFGPLTGSAVDRYLRARRHHSKASRPQLWLGERGQGFSYDGLYRSLKIRATAAGIKRFHPHQLRHSFASRWLAASGSEGGLMAVAGWSRREMLDRYTRSTSERRAAEEAQRLGLGDL